MYVPLPDRPPSMPFLSLSVLVIGQYILYEAVKFDDGFLLLSCGPHADPSVIYSIDPPAVKQPHYKWEKKRQKTQREVWGPRKNGPNRTVYREKGEERKTA